jgi:hypothetical protein
MRFLRGLALALATMSLIGCDYLTGLSGFDDDFPLPSPQATYRTGTATITIGDETIVLDRLNGPGSLFDTFGAEAGWTDGQGWYLRVSGASMGGAFFSGAYVTFDRIVTVQHWSIYDTSRCIVTIDQADTRGLAGSALCRGLRWTDALASFGGFGVSPEPAYIDGQPAFDAEVTFEAVP